MQANPPTVAGPAAAGSLDATVLLDESRAPNQAQPLRPTSTGTLGRTTVLPLVQLQDGKPTLRTVDRPRYETDASLGRGGMGEVLRANDNDIQRPVALKRLLPDAQDPASLSRFVEEVRIVGQLEHPNIVPIHDVGIEAEGQYYFVMKYVEGETLEAIIDKLAAGAPDYHARYPLERRVDIFLGILEAVHYAHERGIIHRDIKPANVMVGPFGEVMVMDWGIAKRLGERSDAEPTPGAAAPPQAGSSRGHETELGALIGTPAYMSPEQAAGDEVDERTDVYSLCVLLHEWLSLRHYLADRSTLGEILQGVREVDAPSVIFVRSRHQPPVPADLHHFVRKGLQKAPADRYRSVAEMIERLRARKEGYIPIQCPLTFTKRLIHGATHLVDRHPLAVLVGLTATAVGVVGAGIAAVLHLLA